MEYQFYKFLIIFKNKYFQIFLFSLGFIITHISFFIYFPIPEISRDSWGYWQPLIDVINNRLPDFSFRPPIYPIILMIFNVTDSILTIMILQSVFSLLISLFILLKIKKTLPKYYYPFLFGLFIFLNSSKILIENTRFLSETIYIDFLLLSFTYMLISIKTNKKGYWGWFSLFCGITILARLQGLYLLVIIALIIVYLLYKKNKIYWGYILLPCLTLIFSLMLYNFIITKNFTLSALTAINGTGSSICFLEPDNSYSVPVNRVINDFNKEFSVNKSNLNSWNINKLSNEYRRWDGVWEFAQKLHFALYNNPNDHLYSNYHKTFKYLKKISLDSKLKNLDLYMKFIYCSFINYNLNLSVKSYFFFTELTNRAKWINNKDEMFFLKPNEQEKKIVLKEYLKIVEKKECNDGINKLLTYEIYNDLHSLPIMVKISFYFGVIHNILFRNIFWIIIFYFLFVFSLINSLFNLNYLKDSNILILVGLFLFFSVFFVSLLQFPVPRLSVSTEFLYYIYPLMFMFLLDYSKFKFFIKKSGWNYESKKY